MFGNQTSRPPEMRSGWPGPIWINSYLVDKYYQNKLNHAIWIVTYPVNNIIHLSDNLGLAYNSELATGVAG